MALRDQPYLPLYVQDFLTDERLIECSAAATGVYIRLMCIMHKSDEYGVIRLKKKDSITGDVVNDFAGKLMRQMPYNVLTIADALHELIDEGVLVLDGERLYQRRMVRDARLSDTRRDAGRRRGTKRSQTAQQNPSKHDSKRESAAEASTPANTENEIETDSVTDTDDEDAQVGYIPTTRAREDGGGSTPIGDDAVGRVFSRYQDSIGFCGSAAADLLRQYTEELGADEVCTALDTAAAQGKRSWSYVNGILRSMCSERRAGIFKPPTLEEVQAYAAEQGRSKEDAQRFYDHYSANGWRKGMNAVVDWRAAFRLSREWRSSSAQTPAPEPAGTAAADIERMKALYAKLSSQEAEVNV